MYFWLAFASSTAINIEKFQERRKYMQKNIKIGFSGAENVSEFELRTHYTMRNDLIALHILKHRFVFYSYHLPFQFNQANPSQHNIYQRWFRYFYE